MISRFSTDLNKKIENKFFGMIFFFIYKKNNYDKQAQLEPLELELRNEIQGELISFLLSISASTGDTILIFLCF